MRCGDLSCAGRPFTEHRHIPVLIADPADSRPDWEQAAGRLRDAIVAGELDQAEPLPSVRELNDPDRVDMKILRQFPEYEEFRTRTKQRKGLPIPGSRKNNGDSYEDLSPREAIEDVIDSAHSAVAADLLARGPQAIPRIP